MGRCSGPEHGVAQRGAAMNNLDLKDTGVLYDVVAVDLGTNRVRLIANSKRFSDAEAIVKMAVMRRGVEQEFFSEVPAGLYKEEDLWFGPDGKRVYKP